MAPESHMLFPCEATPDNTQKRFKVSEKGREDLHDQDQKDKTPTIFESINA